MGLVFGILSSVICIGAGAYLLNLQAAGQNSLIEALAHGIGIYCIGKGLYVGPSLIAQWKTANKKPDPTVRKVTRRVEVEDEPTPLADEDEGAACWFCGNAEAAAEYRGHPICRRCLDRSEQ